MGKNAERLEKVDAYRAKKLSEYTRLLDKADARYKWARGKLDKSIEVYYGQSGAAEDSGVDEIDILLELKKAKKPGEQNEKK